MAEPRDTYSIARREPVRIGPERFDVANHFMAGNGGGPAWGQVSLGEVQIRAADTACGDPDEHFPADRQRLGPFHAL